MLRNGGTTKFSLGPFSAKGGGSQPPSAGAEGARRGGASLSQLESVLQRLNKQDERARIQSVERTSAQTQHKLLRDELLKAQEELALAHTGKNKLCEQIGALQQAKQTQETQIEHLLLELRSSRESQAAMEKKVAELERGSEDLKRNYIRSLTCRTKTASELLSRLHGAGAFAAIADVGATIRSTSDIWIGSDPNKRKRIDDAHVVEGETNSAEDDPMTGSAPDEPAKINAAGDNHTERNDVEANPTTPVATINSSDADVAALTEEQMESCTMPRSQQECQACADLSLQISNIKETAEKEVELSNIELQKTQARNNELLQMNDEAREKLSVLNDVLRDKDDGIAELKSALQVEKDKVMQADETIQKLATAKESAANDDTNVRIKVLEDNLAQLNTYADHLEMLISQCASCSVKLQSENTQDSAK